MSTPPVFISDICSTITASATASAFQSTELYLLSIGKVTEIESEILINSTLTIQDLDEMENFLLQTRLEEEDTAECQSDNEFFATNQNLPAQNIYLFMCFENTTIKLRADNCVSMAIAFLVS